MADSSPAAQRHVTLAGNGRAWPCLAVQNAHHPAAQGTDNVLFPRRRNRMFSLNAKKTARHRADVTPAPYCIGPLRLVASDDATVHGDAGEQAWAMQRPTDAVMWGAPALRPVSPPSLTAYAKVAPPAVTASQGYARVVSPSYARLPAAVLCNIFGRLGRADFYRASAVDKASFNVATEALALPYRQRALERAYEGLNRFPWLHNLSAARIFFLQSQSATLRARTAPFVTGLVFAPSQGQNLPGLAVHGSYVDKFALHVLDALVEGSAQRPVVVVAAADLAWFFTATRRLCAVTELSATDPLLPQWRQAQRNGLFEGRLYEVKSSTDATLEAERMTFTGWVLPHPLLQLPWGSELRALQLNDQCFAGDAGLVALVRLLPPQLEEFGLRRCRGGDFPRQALRLFPQLKGLLQLRVLSFSDMELMAGQQQVSLPRSLTTLSFERCALKFTLRHLLLPPWLEQLRDVANVWTAPTGSGLGASGWPLNAALGTLRLDEARLAAYPIASAHERRPLRLICLQASATVAANYTLFHPPTQHPRRHAPPSYDDNVQMLQAWRHAGVAVATAQMPWGPEDAAAPLAAGWTTASCSTPTPLAFAGRRTAHYPRLTT